MGYVSISLPMFLFLCLFIYLSVFFSVYQFVCLSLCVSLSKLLQDGGIQLILYIGLKKKNLVNMLAKKW